MAENSHKKRKLLAKCSSVWLKTILCRPNPNWSLEKLKTATFTYKGSCKQNRKNCRQKFDQFRCKKYLYFSAGSVKDLWPNSVEVWRKLGKPDHNINGLANIQFPWEHFLLRSCASFCRTLQHFSPAASTGQHKSGGGVAKLSARCWREDRWVWFGSRLIRNRLDSLGGPDRLIE